MNPTVVIGHFLISYRFGLISNSVPLSFVVYAAKAYKYGRKATEEDDEEDDGDHPYRSGSYGQGTDEDDEEDDSSTDDGDDDETISGESSELDEEEFKNLAVK